MSEKINMTIILNRVQDFFAGCFFIRNWLPSLELKKRGFNISFNILGKMENEEKVIEENDIIMFVRSYQLLLTRFLDKIKAKKKKIVYEIDDDLFVVPPVNPAHIVYKKNTLPRKNAILLLKEADLVIVSTNYLKKRYSKYNKNVIVCPNAIERERYYFFRKKEHQKLRIGWTGSVTHYDDLLLIINVIKDLQERYDFDFIIQGITSKPFESDLYIYQFYRKFGFNPNLNIFYDKAIEFWKKFTQLKNKEHIPFYVPEIYPLILRKMDLDIGLCPLIDTSFNRAKSCIKFYEYASVGTVTLASDVLPYKEEVNYRAKNNYKDWKKKLERLIVDEKFREKILKEQQEFVFKNRDIKVVANQWEKAFKSLIN